MIFLLFDNYDKNKGKIMVERKSCVEVEAFLSLLKIFHLKSTYNQGNILRKKSCWHSTKLNKTLLFLNLQVELAFILWKDFLPDKCRNQGSIGRKKLIKELEQLPCHHLV
jgi:hypothetical protein